MRFLPLRVAGLAVLLAACQDGKLPTATLPVGSPLFSVAATPTDLFFSEYIEGSSNNKALEIYNGTGAAIDLAAGGYNVQMYFNGSASAGLTVALTGTVAAGDVYVIAHGSSNATILAQADQTNGSGWFNGDDAVVLRKGTTVLDVIGQIGTDPGSQWGSGDASTADNTLRRKDTVCAGDTDGSNAFDPAAEWNGYASDTFDGLGSHAVSECGTTGGGGGENPAPAPGDIVISELMGDPASAENASWGEWFEVYNRSDAAINLKGWTIVSGGQAPHTIGSDVIVPAKGFAVLGRGWDPTRNGGIELDYNYFTGGTTIYLDDTDWLALRSGTATVDSVRWTSTARGVTRALRDAAVDNTNVEGVNWGYSTTTFGAGDYGTPDAPNGTLSNTPPAAPGSITFSGRTPSDTPLPVGFEDQIFATFRDGTGAVTPTVITWSSETPSLASIDQRGVLRALAAGTAIVRATAADGTTRTYSLPTTVGTSSITADYQGNAEFGEPADGNASDDYLVRYPQFTTSYNARRGTPNWVSYNLEATHIGSLDRCDCFTFDPQLPSDFARYTTADYTGAGTYHGYGIDRGHLVRSFDRTTGTLDNARTFYFTNIIPQAADNNQGPWSVLEDSLGNLARNHNREVYIVAGVAGNKGTLKDEGKIVIPEFVWKVAVIMPRNHGLRNVDDFSDLEVIAVLMPNVAGIRNVRWHTYKTTVNEIEVLTGYNLLERLPDLIEGFVERGGSYQDLQRIFDQLSASVGAISDAGIAQSLRAKLNAARKSIDRVAPEPTIGQMVAFKNEVADLAQSGRLSAEQADSLTAAADRILAMLRD